MKKIFIIGLIIFIVNNLYSQNTQGKADDMARIALTPVIASDLPQEAHNLVYTRLQQIATTNGCGAGNWNKRFIIAVIVNVITKDVISGPPAMIAQNLEASFFIADNESQKVFSTTTVKLKGVGTNETKAYIDAIKNIKSQSPELKQFVETGKAKIIEYYNSQCDFILKQADAYKSQKKYEEAILTLTSIPEICKDCYLKALDAVKPLWQEYIDREGQKQLMQAKATWAANQNSQGAADASQYLANIDPEAACHKAAESLVVEIKKKIADDEKRDWDFTMKVYNDKTDMEKQRIANMRETTLAYIKNQPQPVYNINWIVK